MGFLENLKAELEFQDITVKELSARTNIPKTSLDNYFSGHKSIPKADTAVKIAMALGVSVEFLVTGKDEPCKQLLPADFQEIVNYVKRLSPEDRTIIRTLAKLLAERKSQ